MPTKSEKEISDNIFVSFDGEHYECVSHEVLEDDD